jgi:integrase
MGPSSAAWSPSSARRLRVGSFRASGWSDGSRPPPCRDASDLESGTGHAPRRGQLWRGRGWLALDPTADIQRRREHVDRTRALTRGQLERLFARRDLVLLERTLWRLLYETAAPANELLALNVEDLGAEHGAYTLIDRMQRRPGQPLVFA